MENNSATLLRQVIDAATATILLDVALVGLIVAGKFYPSNVAFTIATFF